MLSNLIIDVKQKARGSPQVIYTVASRDTRDFVPVVHSSLYIVYVKINMEKETVNYFLFQHSSFTGLCIK